MAEKAHALLSASGASRWLSCTPSARLEEQFGSNDESAFAKEGTLAHDYAERILSHELLEYTTYDEFIEAVDLIQENPLFNTEMHEEVSKYTEYCTHQFEAAQVKTPDAIADLEALVDLTEFIPESFGTCDFTIVANEQLEVIDLKYGKGVRVSATANKQLMLYGLGALLKYSLLYDIKTVVLTIVQPRLDNISSWTISADDLMQWAETELASKAKLAFAGEGKLVTGEWCKFCSVKNRCRELANEQLKLAKYEFKAPDLLTDDEIADILGKVDQFVMWANGISAYALQTALKENKQWPGYKLVAGMSRRKWADETEAANTLLANMPSISEDDIYNQKFKSITDIEKMIGKTKFAEIMSCVVIKPQGAPSLVPESDKRPAYGVGQARTDFAD